MWRQIIIWFIQERMFLSTMVAAILFTCCRLNYAVFKTKIYPLKWLIERINTKKHSTVRTVESSWRRNHALFDSCRTTMRENRENCKSLKCSLYAVMGRWKPRKFRSKDEAPFTVWNNQMNVKLYTNLDQPSHKKINTINIPNSLATQNGLETNAYFH